MSLLLYSRIWKSELQVVDRLLLVFFLIHPCPWWAWDGRSFCPTSHSLPLSPGRHQIIIITFIFFTYSFINSSYHSGAKHRRVFIDYVHLLYKAGSGWWIFFVGAFHHLFPIHDKLVVLLSWNNKILPLVSFYLFLFCCRVNWLAASCPRTGGGGEDRPWRTLQSLLPADSFLSSVPLPTTLTWAERFTSSGSGYLPWTGGGVVMGGGDSRTKDEMEWERLVWNIKEWNEEASVLSKG